jgi:hypothetical protein
MPFEAGKPRPKNAGRKKGSENKATPEAKAIFAGILSSQAYVDNLKARFEAGKVHPTIEKMAWEYVHGKPKEILEVSGPDGGPVVTEVKMVIVPRPKE